MRATRASWHGIAYGVYGVPRFLRGAPQDAEDEGPSGDREGRWKKGLGPRVSTFIDELTLRVRFLPGIGEDPTEEWTLSTPPITEELQVDELGLEDAVTNAVEQLNAQTTFYFERRFRKGGWGASGATVLEVVITLATGVASNALFATLVALYKKFSNQEPKADRRTLAPKRRANRRPTKRRK